MRSGMMVQGVGRCLWLGVLGMLIGLNPAQAWVIAPYIQELRADSATLAWERETAAMVTLRYGPADASNTKVALPPDAPLQQLRIDGLEADTVYQYSLEADDDFSKGQFRTAPESPRPVTFALVGNTYDWEDHISESGLAAHLAQWSPDLMLHSGNMVADADEPAAWQAHFQRFAGLVNSHWMIPARGRQDGSLLGDRSEDLFSRYWGQELGSAGVHAFDWGNTRFIVVAHESLLRMSEVLDAHMEDNSMPHTVLLSHNPLYSAGVLSVPNPQTLIPAGAREGLTRYLERYDIPLYLSGSLPIYERSFPLKLGVRDRDGVSYLVQGGAIGGHYPMPFTVASDRIEDITAPTYSIIGMEADHLWLRTFAWHEVEADFVEIDYAILGYPIRLLRESLRELESTGDVEAQKAVIADLGAMGDPEAFDALLAFLEPEHPQALRRAAALALQRIADVDQAEALLPYLSDDDLTVRRHVARALEAASPWALTRELGRLALNPEQDPVVRETLLGAVHRHGPVYYTVDVAEQLLMQPELPPRLKKRAAFAMGETAERRDFEVLLERVREVTGPEALFWVGDVLNELSRGEVETDPESAFMTSTPGAERDAFIEDWRYYMERRLLTERRQEQGRTTGND